MSQTTPRRIVLLEHDANMRHLLCGAAYRYGLEAVPAASFAAARAKLRWFEADGVVVDVDMANWKGCLALALDLVSARVPFVVHTERVVPRLHHVGFSAPIVLKGRVGPSVLFDITVDEIERASSRRKGRSWQ